MPSWQFEEMLGLGVLLVIFAVSLYLLVFQSQSYASIVSCDKNPNIIGCEQRKFVQEKLATEALAAAGCALDSVATGTERCSPEVRRKAEDKTWVSCAATSGQPLRARTVAVEAWRDVELPVASGTPTEARAACTAAGYGSAATVTPLGGSPDGTKVRYRCADAAARAQKAADACKPEALGALKELRTRGLLGSAVYYCMRESGLRCTVHDLELPQEVSDAGLWTKVWGDPSFLLYWQSFPAEEVAWTFEKSHWLTLAVAFIPLMPAGRAAVAAKSVGAGAGTKIGKEVIEEIGIGAATEAPQLVAQESAKRGVASALGTTTAGVLSQGDLKNAAIAATAAEVGQELAASVVAKFDVNGQMLVLKEPGTLSRLKTNGGVTTYPVAGEARVPVLVQWDSAAGPFGGTRTEAFHLVSPCYLEEIAFAPTSAVCAQYTERPEYAVCRPESLGSGGEPLCGVFTPEQFEAHSEAEDRAAYDRATALLKSADKAVLAQGEGSVREVVVPKELMGQRLVYKKLEKAVIGEDGTVTGWTTGAIDGLMRMQKADGSFLSLSCDDKDKGWVEGGADVARCDAQGTLPAGVRSLLFYGPEQGSSFRGIAAEFADGSRFVLASNDGRSWDELTVESGDLKYLLSEADANGNPRYLAMSGCALPAIAAKEDGLKALKVSGKNYCLRHASWTSYGKTTIATVGSIGAPVAAFFTRKAPVPWLWEALFRAGQIAAVGVGIEGQLTGGWPEGWAAQ